MAPAGALELALLPAESPEPIETVGREQQTRRNEVQACESTREQQPGTGKPLGDADSQDHNKNPWSVGRLRVIGQVFTHTPTLQAGNRDLNRLTKPSTSRYRIPVSHLHSATELVN